MSYKLTLHWYLSSSGKTFVPASFSYQQKKHICKATPLVMCRSHRYREVTGSDPVDVLNFFRLLTQLHKLSSQGGSFFNWPLVMSATFQMSFVTRVRGKLWRRRRHHSLGAGRSAAKIFPELAQVSLLAGYPPQDEIHVCII